jgi:predicted GNAT superfamily acetyltransferase
LHRGLGTDRLIVAWDIASPEVEKTVRGERPIDVSESTAAPVINARMLSGRPHPEPPAAPNGLVVRIEVPEDIQREKSTSPEIGPAWRASTRAAFLLCIERGYHVAYFYRDADRRCYYALNQTG